MRKTSAQIADEVIATPTQEMIDHFTHRTNKHIERVRKYCSRLQERIPHLDELKQRAQDHDKGKFEAKEKLPYVWLTWRYKCEDEKKPLTLPTGIKEAIDEATEHHILNNAHHPEFHQGKTTGIINKTDRDKPPKEMLDATRMSKIDLAEMVADWCAMSEERGNTPHEWAKKNVNVRWKFTPAQVKHIDQFMDAAWHKSKTASQIGDEVLKIAIDLPTLRRVSSDLLKRHGVRGGRSTAFDRVWRSPIESQGPEVLSGMSTGPAASPIRRVLARLFPGVKRLSRGTEFDPELLKQLPGPILTGGRKGTLTSLVQRSPLVGAPPPPSPLGKEVLNRVALLHEGFERSALGAGKSMAERMRGWGEQPVKNVEKIQGAVGGGHMSPGVILREHNVMSTLPEFSDRPEVRNVMRGLRDRDKTWSTIQQAVGREIPYGEQRFSRHAMRRIEDLVRR